MIFIIYVGMLLYFPEYHMHIQLDIHNSIPVFGPAQFFLLDWKKNPRFYCCADSAWYDKLQLSTYLSSTYIYILNK